MKEPAWDRHRRPIARVGALAVIVVLALVVSGTGSASSRDNSPIKVGVIESFGGILASIGISEYNGIQTFVDQVNAKGGIKGHPLEIVKRDDNSDPATGIQQLRDLINDPSIVGVAGPTGSGITAATKPVAMAAQIPLVSSVSSGTLSYLPVTWWFRSYVADVEQTQRVLQFLSHQKVGKRAVKRVVLVHADDAFGQSAAAQYAKWQKSFHMSIVKDISYPATTTDPTIQIIQAKATKPDAYIIWDGTSTSRLALAVKALRAQGVGKKALVVLPEAAASDSFIAAAGNAANGCYYFAQFATNDPKPGPQTVFLNGYKKASGKVPDDNNLLGYAAIQILAQGISNALAAGTLTRASVREGIESIHNLQTAVGTVSYSAHGPYYHDPIKIKDVQMNVISNGKRLRVKTG